MDNTQNLNGLSAFGFIRLLLLLAMYTLIFGCAAHPSASEQGLEIGTYHVTDSDSQQYWWYVRFKIVWPPDSDPDFSVDLLLADAVVKPELHTHRNNISYWRFHRRAARDNAGHQFSFIFYTTKDTAKAIYASLPKNELVIQLQQKNIIEQIILDNPENNPRTSIRDTSDKSWSEEIQATWPVYIMGVSNMWLQLIEQEIDGTADSTDINVLVDKYRLANQNVTRLWQTEAQHAFLHHLNAIFGYEPLVIKKFIQF